MTDSNVSPYRPDIDGLRAVAVGSVLLFHAGLTGFSGGFVGVDVFFVISGFLITRIIRNEVLATGGFRFGRFYARRARRLFPALFATLVGSGIAGFLLLAPEHFAEFGGSLLYAVMSISNFYFWQTSGYFDTAIHFKPLLHTWSLSVEEQFYIVWPALLLFLFTGFRKRFALLAIVALGCAGLLLTNHFAAHKAAIFYLAPFRVFEFAIGAVLVWLVRYQARPFLKELLLLVGLGMILYAVLTFNEQTPFPGYAALLPCVGAALAIYAGEARYSGLLLRNPLSVGVGLISYSLYLIHWPLIVFYRYYTFAELHMVEKLALCAVSVLLAVAMYKLVETPFRRPRNPASNPSFGLACALLAMAAILPAANVWAHGGWPWRVNIPKGDIADFVAMGGGEGRFHDLNYGGAGCGHTCTFGTPENERFVLIGDSHGRMYYEGLKTLSAAGKIGFQVFEKGACSFVYAPTKCESKDLAMAHIRAHPDDTVILAQAWMRGNYETEFFKRPEAKHIADPREFATLYLSQLERLLSVDYLNHTKTLVVIGQVPQFAGYGDSLTCMTKPTYLGHSVPCSTARIADYPMLQKYRQFNRLMAEGIAKIKTNAKVVFLDPFDALCQKGTCRQVTDGRLVYSDDDHLSKFGSTLVAKTFKDRLLPLLAFGPSIANAAPYQDAVAGRPH